MCLGTIYVSTQSDFKYGRQATILENQLRANGLLLLVDHLHQG
jgi:hypothetical protein